MKPEVQAAATVAVFDLDETLTRIDTFRPFLYGFLRRHPGRVWRLLLLPVRLLWILVAVAGESFGKQPATRRPERKLPRTRIKQAVLKAFLGGVSRAEAAGWSDIFVERVAAEGLRPGSLQALREHQAAGDRVILATASFDIYVLPLARRLGIDEVLCSRIAWDESGRVAGIDGENCRDHEKLRRVRALLGDDGGEVAAYSDSHADLPLLIWAERGVAVSPTPALAARASDLNLDVRAW